MVGEVSVFCGIEVYVGVEQEDCYIFWVIVEDLQVDVGVFVGGVVEDCVC